MKFRQWLENLELQQAIPPNERFKHIWVNQPNNPQQVASWEKINTQQFFNFPLSKDKFVHFTTPESAEQILRDSRISGNYNFAVSLSFGHWNPGVQFNHVIAKKDKNFLQPYELKKKDLSKKLATGRKIPEFGKELVAVLFKTDTKPKNATGEEVLWEGPVSLIDARIISVRDSIRLLKNTVYGDKFKSFNHFVNYV